MSDQTFVLRPGRLTMADTRRLSGPGSRIALSPAACEAVRTAHAVVDRAVEENRLVYGINTGMGSLADTAIDADQLSELQRRLILSNAAGTGELLPDRVVRRIMLLKINTLGLANSGVRMELVESLIDLFNGDAYPCIPSKGSVIAGSGEALAGRMTDSARSTDSSNAQCLRRREAVGDGRSSTPVEDDVESGWRMCAGERSSPVAFPRLPYGLDRPSVT